MANKFMKVKSIYTLPRIVFFNCYILLLNFISLFVCIQNKL